VSERLELPDELILKILDFIRRGSGRYPYVADLIATMWHMPRAHRGRCSTTCTGVAKPMA
jgi:hypothetical protein